MCPNWSRRVHCERDGVGCELVRSWKHNHVLTRLLWEQLPVHLPDLPGGCAGIHSVHAVHPLAPAPG